jgi:methylated-DNA-protein-cysteine methyltransferase related protein
MKKGVNLEQKSFFERVYEVVRLIPRGRVTTYGDIAAFIGQPGAARMVGWAMNASHTAFPPVPAHRVVNRNGLLSGKHHFHPPELMIKSLENEGVEVRDDKIMNFSNLLWHPMKELK